ncbi:MAG TPA: hypothetical protein VKB05_07150 [Pyrinomonadaceae bacterium]|nr:hypothetical protein [Pyrinomonadaceae bacterium]
MTDSASHSMQDSADPTAPDPDFIKWLKENCVPIVGMVFGGLGLCLVAHYSSITVDWTRTKDFTEAFASVTQSLALIAGVWAYFKFVKGRTFRERLTPTVNGKFISIDGSVFLVVTIMFHNVGLSRIAFDQKVSSLTVFACLPSDDEEIVSVKNKWLAVFQVFGDKDRFIEPNEIVERQSLIALPEVSNIGYQLEVEVVTDSGYAWRATTIVDTSAFEDNEVG